LLASYSLQQITTKKNFKTPPKKNHKDNSRISEEIRYIDESLIEKVSRQNVREELKELARIDGGIPNGIWFYRNERLVNLQMNINNPGINSLCCHSHLGVRSWSFRQPQVISFLVRRESVRLVGLVNIGNG